MAFFDLFFNNKSKNKKNNNFVSTTIKFNNKNVVYPKNQEEEEVKQLYSEIRDFNSSKDTLQSKYTSNALRNSRYFQKQQSTFMSEK